MNESTYQMRPKHIAILAGIVALLVMSVTASAIAITSTGFQRQQAVAETLTAPREGCAHEWRKEVELVHHDAVTHDVEHPPSIASESMTHTVCNSCGDIIDGCTAQHAASTDHVAYTTGVPFMEERVTKAAWTETVIDQEAYDELVATEEVCALCGEERKLVQNGE